MCSSPIIREQNTKAAFSLVEVVIALGVLAFTITALLGVLALGMHTDRESVEELKATHILQTIIAERRASPVLSAANFVLPPLDIAAIRNSSSSVPLDELGQVLEEPASAKFGLVYRVTPDSTTNSAGLYCAIYWPGQASPANAQGRVEMVTRIPLP